MNTNSGDGERTAMLGYVPQYEIAAHLIYEALLNGSLEWFSVADPDAGSLDDILIATTGKLEAYQVKWAEFSGTISYADFVRDSSTKQGSEKLSLFKQLTEGWARLSENYKERDVKVHLLHKLVPSTNPQAKIPLSDVPPKYPHFQSFLKDCWLDRSWSEIGIEKAAPGWRDALLDLKKLSGFDDEQFLKFISCCELGFNYRRPSDIAITTKAQARKREDIGKIYNLLTQMAGGEYRIIQQSKDDMLDKLAWGYRFKHKFVHEFPVDRTYQEISETVNSISNVLSQKKQGYIALLGSPGSGKSTTLTRTLKYKSGYKLVRYYAYVPDSTYQGRGEATTFLHDITLSLRNHGFRGDRAGQAGSREEYLSLLGEQLQQAHQKWKQDNIVTIVMVDGLDHIQREQSPLQSLLSDLPPPSTIPDGVIFILGSQTLELVNLSDSIKEHVKRENRTIVISPLSRSNVYAAINGWPGCSELADDSKKAIFEKSSGHPLSLVYLLQFISTSAEKDFDKFIGEFPPYQGHIEQSYSVFWRQIEGNHELVNLLALLSRLRGQIDTSVLSSWTDDSTIYQFVSNTSHYFKKDSDVSWRFFHNSFRQFILDKTSRNAFGKLDESKNKGYHTVLAEHSLSSSENDPMRWEVVHHLFKSQQIEKVIETGTQSYFREQFFNLRNFSSVIDDIDYVLLSAKKLNDPLAVVRCILIECELRERKEAINEIDVLKLLFASEGIDSALSYMFDGDLLRVSESEALAFSKTLAENELFNEAKRVFESAEPLSYLSGGDKVDPHHGGAEDLKKWASVAHFFISLEDIVSTIFQTKYQDDESGAWNKEDEDLHNRLMKRLVDGVYETKDEEKINELFFLLLGKQECFESHLSLCFSICINQYPPALTKTAYSAIVEWSEDESDELQPSDMLLVTELEYRTNGSIEQTKKWFEKLDQPKLYKHGVYGRWKDLSPFVDRIRFNRLLAALGQELDPVKAIPNNVDQKYKGNVLFERGLVRFSSIWGKGWAGEKLSPSFIVQEVKSAFQLLRKPHSQTKEWIGWHEFESAAVDYFNFAIRASSQHGHECIQALADAFIEDWSKRYWPTSWRREIIFTLYKKGCSRASLIDILSQIEEEIPDFDEIHSKISEYYELSLVWSKVGEPKRAASLVPQIFIGSFGIYHGKDRQFTRWVSWLGKLVNQYPHLAYEEICRFSSALVSLEQSRNGSGTQEAGRDLVAIVTSWNSEYGLKLLKWLFDNKGLDFAPGLTGLLSGMLDRSDPPFEEILTITKKLLIPFEEYNPSDLPKQLSSLYCMSNENENKSLEKLIYAARTHLLPSNRYSWLEGIALGMREAGRDNRQYASIAMLTPKEKHVTHEPSLKLKTGEQLTSEEVQLKVFSVESLLQIVRSVKSIEYFNWLDLIQPFLNEMNVCQLDELNKLLQRFKPEKNAIASIACALGKKGELDKANNILKGLFDGVDAKGWDLHWDGGSKQSIFKALVEMDGEQWRPKAISCLVDDYISEYRYPSSLIMNFEEIANILFEDVDILPLWEEIKEHVYQLDDFKEVSDRKAPILLEYSEIVADSSLLIQFAFDMFDLGIPELAHMAHQAILDFSKNKGNWPSIHREVASRINKLGLTQVKILSLLESFITDCEDFVAQFDNEIISLCASDDFSSRMVALSLSNKLGVEGSLPVKSRSKLPFVYELELQKIQNKKEAIPFSALRPGETLPDVEDPIELLRPLLTEAKLVADMSNVPFENIIFRASELMKTLVPESEWNKQAEESYRKWMEGFGLKLTYHRLRPKMAKLALSHVVCELLDSGQIPSQELDILKSIFKRNDEMLLALEPSIRPERIIIPNASNQDVMRNHEDWLVKIDEGVQQFSNDIETGEEIIGELTAWSWLDWDVPTETRMSTICHPEWNISEDIDSPSELFPSMMHWAACDYPAITPTDKPSLIIYGSGSYIDHGGVEWLALNPHVGFSLRWSLSDEGLFRWVNQKGDVMVESIYWKDGPISRLPPKMDDICSNGWLVIASKKAIEEIRSVIGKAVQIKVVVRSYGHGTYEPTSKRAKKITEW